MASSSPDKVEPIAVIGMACRFPGDGRNVEELYAMLNRGDNAWTEFPADRLNINGFFHPSGTRQGSIGFRGGHFIDGNFKAFDAPVSFSPPSINRAILTARFSLFFFYFCAVFLHCPDRGGGH